MKRKAGRAEYGYLTRHRNSRSRRRAFFSPPSVLRDRTWPLEPPYVNSGGRAHDALTSGRLYYGWMEGAEESWTSNLPAHGEHSSLPRHHNNIHI